MGRMFNRNARNGRMIVSPSGGSPSHKNNTNSVKSKHKTTITSSSTNSKKGTGKMKNKKQNGKKYLKISEANKENYMMAA